jgi:hypothetical protein
MMVEPYRPSSGSEGADFQERFCIHCERDRAFRETDYLGDAALGCQILAATYRYAVDHPDYPKEWIEDERGARCTAFTTDPTCPVRCDRTLELFHDDQHGATK